MKKKLFLIFLGCIMTLSLLAGCPQQQPKQEGEDSTPKAQEEAKPEATVIAQRTDNAPDIDGANDDIWNDAKALTVTLKNAGDIQGGTGGKFDNGSTDVSIKALYDDENIYMQFQWKDPTDSKERGPWIKEGDKLVLKPYDEFYEDKLALLWNMNDSVKDFNDNGCMVTCHVTEFKTEDGKSIKKHYTNADNEMIDMWHWKRTRQNTLYGPDKPGLMHDQNMDNMKFNPEDKETENAGRHSDPGEKEYKQNANEDKTQPLYVFDGESKNGNPYVIVDKLDPKKDFDPGMVAQMKEGDFIPGAIAFQITGDPADIPAKGKWENGMWTLETKRKLKTDSNKDIQFNDLTKAYFFGIAAFDNSQIGHAYQIGVQKLIFQEKK